ncbi:MAG: hypothetical protein JWO27_1850 [Frankiales bacterium]|nr:hypothetical protein [Frankiales bacterium]
MVSRMPSPLTRAVQNHLMLHGPCTVEEIHEALAAQAIMTTRTATGVRNALTGSPFAFRLPDERWDLTSRAMSGVILTVRPRSRLRDSVLWVHRDLEPFDGLLTGREVPLLSGGCARLGGGSEVRTLVGPDGWLPEIPPGGLVGLRWSGHALDVFPIEQPVPTDPAALAPVRDLLRRHSESLSQPHRVKPELAAVFLSALREAPELFSQPLPPLSEILPLPEHAFDDTALWEAHRDGRRLTLHLPPRVYDELSRRADLLGEQVPDHAAVLLGAAVDRVQALVRARHDPPYYEDRYRDDDVLSPLRWTS